MKDVEQNSNKSKKNIKNNNMSKDEKKKENFNRNVAKPQKDAQNGGVRVKEIKVTTIDDDFDEDEDKKLIVVIAIAILIIMATVLGLLIGCDRKEVDDPLKVDEDIVEPVEEDEEEEEVVVEEETIKKVTSVVKDEEQDEEIVPDILNYSVKFLFSDNTLKYLEVEEDSIVTPYVPVGYSYCNYYIDKELTKEYNFKNRVNEDTVIYTVCKADNYTIEYNVSTDNATIYNAQMGKVVLNDATVENGLVFLGWYLDVELTKEVSELTSDIIKYADENKIIKLYARFDELNVTYFDNLGNELSSQSYSGKEDIVYEPANQNVCANGKLLGWSNEKESKVINYALGSKLGALREDIDLYAVCGTATVVYSNDVSSVSMGYTNEDLKEYNLPKPSDISLDTPIYYVPVDEEIEGSKVIVPDEAIDLLENQIRLQDVKNSAASNYLPQVGDIIVEHNKVFIGWIIKEEEIESFEDIVIEDEIIESTDPLDEVVSDDIVIPDIEVLPDDFVPTENETTNLEAVYREQTEEELISGIYDNEELEQVIEDTSIEEELIEDTPLEEELIETL